MPARRFAFVFVCHAGRLEPMSLLLAAALRRHTPAGSDVVAALPEPAETWGAPADATLAGLAGLGVRLEPIEPWLGWDCPHANKVAALLVPHEADRLVFLDTDTLPVGPFADRPEFDADFAAKPSDTQSWTRDPELWRRTYEACGVALPERRVRLTASGELSPPYYNSGVLVLARPRELAAAWRSCMDALAPLRGDVLPSFFYDQWSLSPALELAGMTASELGDELNFPGAVKMLPGERPPSIYHYHRPQVAATERVIRGAVRELAAEHAAVGEALAADAEWQRLLAAPDGSPVPTRELLVAGMPGTGTARLCELLDGHGGCRARLDHPALLHALRGSRPWQLTSMLRMTRERLFAAGGIGPDDLLALGNEGGLLLGRLEAARRVLPNARVVLCVRDPRRATAAWKREADTADPAPDPDSGPVALDRAAQAELEAAVAAPRAADRRALLWAWAARRVCEQRDGAILVDADRLDADPAGVLAEVLDGLDAGAPPGLAPRPSDDGVLDVLDAEDVRAIEQHCEPLARRLGYAGAVARTVSAVEPPETG